MRTPDGLTVLGPDDGDAFPGDIVVKARASETGGSWGLALVSGEPGEGGRTHLHRGEAEAFFLLEGRIEFLGAESVTPLEPGSFVLVPPDTEHGVRIVGETTARWLAIWPSALDGYPEEAKRVTKGGSDATALDEVRRRHGMELGRQR